MTTLKLIGGMLKNVGLVFAGILLVLCAVFEGIVLPLSKDEKAKSGGEKE